MENNIVTNKYLTRQSDLIPEKVLDTEITVVGAGAIGSMVVLTLAKMGFNNITVFDYDEVDYVNINNQFYRISDIGKKKVDALKDLVLDFTGITINSICDKAPNVIKTRIVVSAVDSMKSRKEIYDAFLGDLLVDPRMSIEYANMFTYVSSWDDPSGYTGTLYSDDEAIRDRCTAKATMYTATLLSGTVCKCILDYVLGRKMMRNLQWDIEKNAYCAYVEGQK